MFRRLVSAGATIATACCFYAPPSMAGGGNFSVDCHYLPEPLTFQFVDPVVNFMETHEEGDDHHHLHVFRGNHLIGDGSTWTSLRAAGSNQTGCRRDDTSQPGGGDLSAYWAPTLMRDETPVNSGDHAFTPERLTKVNTYYEAPHANYDEIEPYPNGLKIIARDPAAEAAKYGASLPEPFGARLACVNGRLIEQGDALQCLDTNLVDNITPGIRLQVKFPSCLELNYDPETAPRPDPNDRDDSAHVTYPVAVGSGWRCPPSFPTPLPQLFIQFGWQTKPDAKYYFSHHLPGHMGHDDKWHADFFNGWDENGMLRTLVDNCLRKADVVCGAGNGTVPPPPEDPTYFDSDPDPCAGVTCAGTTSAVAHWAFDEIAGTTAFGQAFGGPNGTYTGTYELGRPALRPSSDSGSQDRSVLLRDAMPGEKDALGAQLTSGRVVVTDEAALRPNDAPFTIEGWARFPDKVQTAILYSKRQISGGSQMLVLFLGKLDQTNGVSGRKLCLIVRQDATRERATCTEHDVADGGVHHFAARVDPKNSDGHNRLTLYVDGQPVQDRVARWTVGTWPSVYTSAPVQIGGNQELANDLGPVSLDGEMDDLWVFSGARSSAQIAADHQAGLAP